MQIISISALLRNLFPDLVAFTSIPVDCTYQVVAPLKTVVEKKNNCVVDINLTNDTDTDARQRRRNTVLVFSELEVERCRTFTIVSSLGD